MPEFPEVHTIKKQLEKELPFTIKKVEMQESAKSIMKDTSFLAVLPDSVIMSVEQFGKYLRFPVGVLWKRVYYLFSHFGMTGGWQIKDINEPKSSNTHISLIGENKRIDYVDARRFGKVYLTKNPTSIIKDIGPNPFTEEFDYGRIKTALLRYGEWEIKPLLLDQAYFAGVGNYLASEICYSLKIHPSTLAKNIPEDKIKEIKSVVEMVIKRSIEKNGLSIWGGYHQVDGTKGEAISVLRVYGQKKCMVCDSLIIKYPQQGRTTWYCEVCQPKLEGCKL